MVTTQRPGVELSLGNQTAIDIGRPMQAAYVTGDIEHAVEIFQKQFSIHEFLRIGPVDVDLGHNNIGQLKVALAYRNGFQYELIEPVSGAVSLYRDAIEPDAAATFHHIAYALSTRAALDQLRRTLEADHNICIYGEWGVESAYFYTDTRNQLGHFVEYIFAESEFDALIPRN